VYKNFLIFFLFLCLVFPQFNTDRLLNIQDDFEYLGLHLDYNSINRSSFMLDKYYPNHFIDYRIYSLNVSGTMIEPIFQMTPSNLFFDIDEKGKISQLFYKENKSSEYFDTKMSLKVDMHKDLKFLGHVESKSFKENINQNYLFNIFKHTARSELGVSYLYHFDDSPIEYLDSVPIDCQTQNYYGLYFSGDNINLNCGYDSFEKKNESFVLGIDYLYENESVSWKHFSSFQVSNTAKDFTVNTDLNYDNKYSWHHNNLGYEINEKTGIYYDYKSKKTFIDNYDEYDLIDSKEDLHKFGSYYKINRFKLDFNFNYLGYSELLYSDYMESFGAIISFSDSNYSFQIGSKYDLKSNFYNIEDGDISLVRSYISKKYMSFDYENIFINTNLDFGIINIDYFNGEHPFFNNVDSFKYNYLIFTSRAEWKSLKFHLNYSFYDTDFTYLNQYVDLTMSYSPQVKNVRYKPFCIFSVNSVVINSIYELNLNSSNLFEYDLNNFNLDDKRVNFLNAQIGLLFDGFRISYEMMNPFNERYNNTVQYSDNLLPQLGGFSKINIIWIFKD